MLFFFLILKKQVCYLSEKPSKSETRSHIRSPLRAALEEYTGPMPFFVVPKLKNKPKQASSYRGKIYVFSQIFPKKKVTYNCLLFMQFPASLLV